MTFELRPFFVGPIRVDFPVVLAPLAGYTDLPFRRICRRLGAPYCTTEMLLDKSVLVRGKLRSRILQIGHDEHPVAGQLIGCQGDTMAQAAVILQETGFDVIDLNFACPMRRVISRKRGGHFLREPALAVEIVRAVRAAVDRPVTVKLRRKFHDADGDDAFWRIAEGAFQAGAAALCVHARSVEQKYAGRADWDFLAEVKRRFADRTIIGSGDVLTPADAVAMLERTGVDAVAAARGALGNPWFFQQVRQVAAGGTPRTPPLEEQKQLLAAHFEEIGRLYGPDKGLGMMRKFAIRYARMHPTPRAARAVFVGIKKLAQWEKSLDDLYGRGEDNGPAPPAE